jgi:hypothetical protein
MMICGSWMLMYVPDQFAYKYSRTIPLHGILSLENEQRQDFQNSVYACRSCIGVFIL